MTPTDATGLFAGAILLGLVHGIEPGHGWPVAASYALDQSNKWLYGLAASLLLGIGHLVSSIAVVVAFFFAKSYLDLAEVDEPLSVAGIEIGGPIGIVAGVLLIGLAIREYRHGHSHSHGDGHDHSHDRDRGRNHAHDRGSDRGLVDRVKLALPFVGGHDHGSPEEATDRGLWGIAGFAFVLGFAHEEEFEIIALCAGSEHCLSLMVVYALTVVAGIVALTLLLTAGYERYEARVERYTEYLPAFSAAVLLVMGLGFVFGLF